MSATSVLATQSMVFQGNPAVLASGVTEGTQEKIDN